MLAAAIVTAISLELNIQLPLLESPVLQKRELDRRYELKRGFHLHLQRAASLEFSL